MKKSFSIVLIALLGLANMSLAQERPQQDPLTRDWANFKRYAQANETAPKGANAVLMGNSITDMWVRADPAFFTDNNYIGRGIGGQVTAQMLSRFRADVLDLQPKSVAILAGTNDIARNEGFVAIENIFGNIVSMCELAKYHGIQVVICAVFPVYDYRWRPRLEPAPQIVKLNGLLKEFAEKNNMIYVDYYTPMVNEKGGLPEKYAKDGVHPTAEGYAIMKSLLKPAIDEAVRRYNQLHQ